MICYACGSECEATEEKACGYTVHLCTNPDCGAENVDVREMADQALEALGAEVQA